MRRYHILLTALILLGLGIFFSFFHVEILPQGELKLERGIIRHFDYQARDLTLQIRLVNKKTTYHGRYMHHRRDGVRILKVGDIVNIWSQPRLGFPMKYFPSESQLILKLQHQNLIVLDYQESSHLAKNKVKTANWVGWALAFAGFVVLAIFLNPKWARVLLRRSQLTSAE